MVKPIIGVFVMKLVRNNVYVMFSSAALRGFNLLMCQTSPLLQQPPLPSPGGDDDDDLHRWDGEQ